jgi:hypothetical protein
MLGDKEAPDGRETARGSDTPADNEMSTDRGVADGSELKAVFEPGIRTRMVIVAGEFEIVVVLTIVPG